MSTAMKDYPCLPCVGEGTMPNLDGSGFHVCLVCKGSGDATILVPPTPGVYQRLRNERQKDYGEPLMCHAAIALAWMAVLKQRAQRVPVDSIDFLRPGDVALMFTMAKIVREAHAHKQDNLDDAIVYLKFAGEFAEGK